ncbi:hypothetical protein DFH07DRAFT_765351 [Mycena maculata]|uniref:Uncharacterized protein n=1 Tax=Mycena maculata TaxID=230809 RepID=A0AAD7K9K3_9AGAR|nr:hypothetical protein DFH07DRAFT_765351 [Mycena maculata]
MKLRIDETWPWGGKGVAKRADSGPKLLQGRHQIIHWKVELDLGPGVHRMNESTERRLEDLVAGGVQFALRKWAGGFRLEDWVDLESDGANSGERGSPRNGMRVLKTHTSWSLTHPRRCTEKLGTEMYGQNDPAMRRVRRTLREKPTQSAIGDIVTGTEAARRGRLLWVKRRRTRALGGSMPRRSVIEWGDRDPGVGDKATIIECSESDAEGVGVGNPQKISEGSELEDETREVGQITSDQRRKDWPTRLARN